MKIRVALTGGIPLRSLQTATLENDLNSPVYDTWQDTWPLDDLIHDIFSQNFDSEYDVLACCLQELAISAVSKALMNEAALAGWEAGLCDLGESAFHIDVPLKKIILNSYGLSPAAFMRSNEFRTQLMLTMVRALRDIWHEKRHGGFDEKFTPESILMLERVRAADCDVMTVLAAWEMRSEGKAEIWRQLLASDNGDLAIAFGCVFEKNTRSYPMHKALEAAFSQWYQISERVMICDHETLEYIDEVVRNGLRVGKKAATASEIEVLSCLPDRTAYLQGCGGEILRSPLYAGLHDAVNQSHFLQIMHDIQVTYVQGVPFRDAGLAAKIFPGGQLTAENGPVSETSSSS